MKCEPQIFGMGVSVLPVPLGQGMGWGWLFEQRRMKYENAIGINYNNLLEIKIH